MLPTASASLLSVHRGPWALYKDLCINLQEFPFVISGTVISGELCLHPAAKRELFLNLGVGKKAERYGEDWNERKICK